MLTKKNMVLSSVNNDDKKGVLSMEVNGGSLSGRVRLYNFSSQPLGILSLGVATSKGVIKAGLTHQGNMLFTFGASVDELPESFSCALVNFVGGQPKPILYGSSAGAPDLEKTLGQVVESLGNTNSAKEVEKVLDDFGIDYDDEEKENIEKEINKNFEKPSPCKNCDDCVYKKYFFEHNETSSLALEKSEPQKVLEPIEKKEEVEVPSFYNDIKKQVDTLFSENKPEEFLEKAIPNSKWVKVDFEDGGEYYVFGLLYEDDELKYVCYGIPSIFSSAPPKQLSGYPIWFPLEKDKKDGFGYWLSYQDAATGESIKAIVE